MYYKKKKRLKEEFNKYQQDHFKGNVLILY